LLPATGIEQFRRRCARFSIDLLGLDWPHIVESSFKTSFPADPAISVGALLCKLSAQ
jgi:hypothetical protein